MKITVDRRKPASRRYCSKGGLLRCVKSFIAFLFSRIGLSCVMAGYIAFGGWMFELLEKSNEIAVKRKMQTVMNITLERLWSHARIQSLNGDYDDGTSTIIRGFEEDLVDCVRAGYNGVDNPEETEWNFFGAVLYATTLVSTIGYGHVTCKTVGGKLLTILYSAVGMPLMMLFSANIGSSMAASFRFVYVKFLKKFKRKKASRRQLPEQLWPPAKYPNSTMTKPQAGKRWSPIQVGFKIDEASPDVTRDDNAIRLIDKLIKTQQTTPTADVEKRLDQLINGPLKHDEHFESGYDNFRLPNSLGRENTSPPTQKLYLSDTRVDIPRSSPKKPPAIPVALASLILVLYMLGGACLFDAWEKDWSFLSSFYFCFVTITTIGFGDMVPGKTLARTSPYKFIIATCYIILGLVLIAMCLDLVKERIIQAVTKCTRKMGIRR